MSGEKVMNLFELLWISMLFHCCFWTAKELICILVMFVMIGDGFREPYLFITCLLYILLVSCDKHFSKHFS